MSSNNAETKTDGPQKCCHRGAPRCASIRPRRMIPPEQRRVKDLLSKTLPHLPPRMISTDHHNTVCFASHLRGDLSQPCPQVNQQKITAGVKLTGSNCLYHPPPREQRQEATAAAGDYCQPPRESSTDGQKLKIRGLKKFIDKHGGRGVPPNWVKEFPCRSRFHPNTYLYDFEEGPLNPKRNVEALAQCQFKGGRCPKCGVYTAKLCDDCKYCEADCSCPGIPRTSDKVKPKGHTLNPFGGMPSMDSFGETLSKAQDILTSSQHAPKQYPFRLDSPDRDKKFGSSEGEPVNQSQHLTPPPQPAANQIPFFPPYPYPYGNPPLPYMIPPPPPYGYPYPPPPIPFGYPFAYPPPPPPAYGYPYQQYPPPMFQHPQHHPLSNSDDFAQKQKQSQPTCTTRISVNNDRPL